MANGNYLLTECVSYHFIYISSVPIYKENIHTFPCSSHLATLVLVWENLKLLIIE